jgi:threonine dehydratase
MDEVTLMKMYEPSLQDIFLARHRLQHLARKTPLVASHQLSQATGRSVHLKLENMQETGSFKVRGAANKLLTLNEEEQRRGVITFSTGNHGRAVAYVAKQLGIKAVICVSDRVPQYRIDAMKQLGAEVVQYGKSQDETYEHALTLQEERGLTMVNPFDDPLIIAGQGTIGLEILEDLPSVDTVIVPVSGGGLIAGIALAMKSADSKIRVVGVSMDCGPAMYHSIKAGKPVEVEERDSIADALLGGIDLKNRYTFRMVQEYVDELILVSEQQIAEGMFFALDKHRLVVEGAGAVGISALLFKRVSDLGQTVVVVLSGGNADPSMLIEIASKRYTERDR